MVELVAESGLAVWLVPGLDLSAFHLLHGGGSRSISRHLHGEAVLVTRLGGIVCSDEHVAPPSSSGIGQLSHTRAGYSQQVLEKNLPF